MNVALIGYGKMGKEIERVLTERGHRIVLIIDVDNTQDLNAEKLAAADVAIEFTTPDTAYANVVRCLECGTPVVCGTTAWLDKLPRIEALCKKENGTFFYATNYSVGVNVFFEINRRLAALMNAFPEYDVTIEEVHHTQKKDAPSGTAVTLAEDIVAGLDRKARWVGETTTVPEELEVLGIRRSVVPGTHTVTYESPVDSITMVHTAKNRQGLALGAVLAAEYIRDKKGIFSMKDLLGL
ncbi:MAG: 4-hydroxy-tetrahydrodipicolinate reductase [Rikenellaceae bacterium]|nr:4-hydroxy-tetrahydrodipicolinate reductase [Rikenellaceae bacterium]